MTDLQNNLLGLPPKELQEFFEGLEEKTYRAKQLMQWVYSKQVYDFNSMTNFNVGLREYLDRHCTLTFDLSSRIDVSRDGTTKWLIGKQDNQIIETVFIPEDHRGTLCISSQIGCLIDCPFCATGHQGFNRNLKAHEIIGQVLVAREGLGEEKKITNIVFMGMGEPLANYNNTLNAIRVLNDGQGLSIGARHITVSTVGLIPEIEKLAKEDIQVNLAVSLHAPDDATRSETMPINKRYPIADLIEACKDYVLRTNRRIFFEYVLLKGQNDSVTQSHKLGVLLRGLLCHVNLIPVNPTGDGPYERTDLGNAKEFQVGLQEFGIPSTVRMEKGIDINAGCGQLRARVLEN